ncbi:unnamed protein product [Somion occarium]|uniref:Uncharacterized protein n=1 Tax=Somion occarium TaxID=3059160 RepID=A0ABP1CXZ4_9APHY
MAGMDPAEPVVSSTKVSIGVQAPPDDPPPASRGKHPPLVAENRRLMMYGYCVSVSWIRYYAREHGWLTPSGGADDTKVFIDLTKKLGRWDHIMAPSVCVYRKPTMNGQPKSALCLNSVKDRQSFQLAFIFGSGTNRTVADMEDALNPSRIQTLKEVMRMEREPLWYYLTQREHHDQPWLPDNDEEEAPAK